MFARDWNVAIIRRPGTNLTTGIAEDVFLSDTIEKVWPKVNAKVTWGVLHCLSRH